MIRCGNYDSIELVCLFHYPVAITLASGDVITGTAQDTQRNDQREECIRLHTINGDLLVVLDTIRTLTVLVDNPHIRDVTFATPAQTLQ